MKKLTAIVTLTLASTVASADVATNKQTALNAINDVFVGLITDKIDDYFADPYIQHNPIAESGVESLKGLIANAKAGPGFGFENHRIIGEGDLVALHSIWTGFGPKPQAAFDIYRFDSDGKIVEHWDNLIPIADKPNPSGRTQVDGATEISDLDQTAANKAKVEEFITRALIKGEKVDYTMYINPAKYLQHNPEVADGLDGFGAFMAELGKNNIKMIYKKIGVTVAEGNFVLTGSEGSFGDKPTAYYDLFRLEDGLIVEHWDVIADMPSGKLPKGYPGKF